jgi:tryptophan synthase beta subunit
MQKGFLPDGSRVIVCLSGRGDKDMESAVKLLEL